MCIFVFVYLCICVSVCVCVFVYVCVLRGLVKASYVTVMDSLLALFGHKHKFTLSVTDGL